MKKAEFIESYVGRGDKYRSLVYKYRGYEYTIYDYGCIELFPYGDSLKEQHQKEQARIDDIILHEDHQNVFGADAMDDFNFFWDYVYGLVNEGGENIEK